MEALDRYTFEQWQESNQKYLDAKFASVCTKLDAIKAQRLEDCEHCEKYRTECKGNLEKQIQEMKNSNKKTVKLLTAGIVLSVLVCLSATGVIPFGIVWKALTSMFSFAGL